MKWVKASERLPKGTSGHSVSIAVKYHLEDGDQIRGCTINQFLDMMKIAMDKDRIEWLDESPSELPEDIEKWIEDEAKLMEKAFQPEGIYKYSKTILTALYQLLLPQLQQQKETIDELKKELTAGEYLIQEYRNALNNELEVHKEFIQQAAEIESLKQENERLKTEGRKMFEELQQSAEDYWKQRCEAAEYLMSVDAMELQPHFDNWHKLKQQTQ